MSGRMLRQHGELRPVDPRRLADVVRMAGWWQISRAMRDDLAHVADLLEALADDLVRHDLLGST